MVGTLVASAILGAAAAGTFAYAATVFAVNFALSMIVTRVFGDNPETQQDMGVRQQVPPSAVNAIPVVYGSAYMGGTFVDAVLTEDQKTMYYVLAISCISPNGQFSFNTSAMYYGDRLITFGTGADSTKVIMLTDEAENENTKISGNLYISLYTSTAGGTIVSANGADAPSVVMGGSDIAVGQRWVAGVRQMNGLAFAIVKLVYNRDADTTQLSPITFNVNHYLNSTGTAKPGDVWKDYITSTVYGGAVNLSFVDTASATALNAYSDELITFKNSSGVPSTQSRYRINGVLDAGQTVLSNLDRIMSACDSWMTYNAALGQWSVVINKAETASYAFTDNNIIGEIRVSATDITSSINQVEARFPFKENRDQAAFVNIKTPTGLLYPNEPVNKYSITYDLVNDSVQTGYLANRLLEQAREDLIVSFSTTYYGIQVDAGNVVSVTNTDYGWNAKLFRVMKVNEASLPDGSLGAKLELSEYNAQVYDDLDITAFTAVPNSGLPSVSYFSPLSAPTVTGYPSATIPNFSVTVFVPTTGRVTFGNLFFTTSPTPTAGDWQLLTSASTANNQPVTNNTYYTYTNLTLNTGTYYFAYQVGNEISNSVISPISAAFVWNPVASAGPTGANGTRTAILDMYQWSATAPTTFPVGTSVYTWATGQFTAPATPNGWSLTPPATVLGQTLWIARTIYSDSLTTATSTVTWSATVAYAVGGAGANGTRTAFLELYQWATSTPTTFPSGNSTYTWATGAFTAPTTPNSWLLTPGASTPGYTLYGCSVRYADSLTTATSTVAWTTSTAYAVGAAGTNGTNGTTGSNGLLGLSALTAYYVQAQNLSAPTFTTPTTGPNAPSGWSLTASSVGIGQVLWYIQGRYNANAVTLDGVGAGQTAWTGPVAASIFQDIRSDNWNGSNPPTYGSTGTYGTVGYYIQQSTGDAYFNRGIFRGTVESAVSGSRIILGESASEYLKVYDSIGNTVFRVAGVAGLYTNVQVVGASNTFGIGALSVSNAAGFGGAGLNVTNNGTGHGITSVANSTGPTRNAVLAVGYGSTTDGAALYGANGGNYGVYCYGRFGVSDSTVVTNLNANYLQGYTASNFMLTGSTATDSNALGGVTASSWARIFPTNSGTANAGGSGVNLLGSTSTGIAGAYVGTSGTSNIVTWTVQTTSPSDIRLKEEIADSDLGLAFVKQLRPVSYKLKADPKHQKGYGFIAQEVEALIGGDSSLVYYEPDWKVGDETGFNTIHYPSYIAVLTKAIQELTAKVESLEAQIKG